MKVIFFRVRKPSAFNGNGSHATQQAEEKCIECISAAIYRRLTVLSAIRSIPQMMIYRANTMEQSKNKILVESDGMTCHLIFVDVHQTEIFLFMRSHLFDIGCFSFSFHSRMRTWNV